MRPGIRNITCRKKNGNKHRPCGKKLQIFQAGKNMKINIGHEARNYKPHMPEKKHEINIGQEARHITNISCRKYMKQTSAMRQEITNISGREKT